MSGPQPMMQFPTPPCDDPANLDKWSQYVADLTTLTNDQEFANVLIRCILDHPQCYGSIQNPSGVIVPSTSPPCKLEGISVSSKNGMIDVNDAVMKTLTDRKCLSCAFSGDATCAKYAGPMMVLAIVIELVVKSGLMGGENTLTPEDASTMFNELVWNLCHKRVHLTPVQAAQVIDIIKQLIIFVRNLINPRLPPPPVDPDDGAKTFFTKYGFYIILGGIFLVTVAVIIYLRAGPSEISRLSRTTRRTAYRTPYFDERESYTLLQ